MERIREGSRLLLHLSFCILVRETIFYHGKGTEYLKLMSVVI